MIDVDFIEIGTSDFDTYVETAHEDEVGFCVEPIKHYLDKLPNRKNVTKVNCAIAFDNVEKDIDIYYIPEEILVANNLPVGLKGCNSINKYHYQHTKRNIEHLVKINRVRQIPLTKFLQDNNIRKIKYLKIDTEGGDCFILSLFLDYLKDKSIEYYPNKIKFETNLLTPKDLILQTIENYKQIGYTAESFGSFDKDGDTVLTLK